MRAQASRVTSGARARASPRCRATSASTPSRAPALVISRTVRAGERVEHDGDVLVYGDVARDGAVRATRGDVTVWGALLGEVETDEADACVRALDMRPAALRIGDARWRSPTVTDAAEATGRPAVARAAMDGEDVVIRDEDVGGYRSTTTTTTSASVRRSSLATGAYIGAVGFALLVAPEATFSIVFSAAEITSAWIRVFGVLCVTFGAYYIGTPLYELRGCGVESFYRSTVLGRVFVFAALCALAAFERRARIGLIALGVINALSASVMHRALERGRH